MGYELTKSRYCKGVQCPKILWMDQHHPDLSAHLMDIHDNMHDLMIPFQKQYYYSKEMQGSYSIKHVLPAL